MTDATCDGSDTARWEIVADMLEETDTQVVCLTTCVGLILHMLLQGLVARGAITAADVRSMVEETLDSAKAWGDPDHRVGDLMEEILAPLLRFDG